MFCVTPDLIPNKRPTAAFVPKLPCWYWARQAPLYRAYISLIVKLHCGERFLFGLFKKKQTPKPSAEPSMEWNLRSAVAPLLALYESFSAEITESYSGIDHNPAELRFFTMAATSLFVQAFGELPEEEMQALVGMFYEQSAANIILSTPRADFSLVHSAATQRFGHYAEPIIGVINADTSEELQSSNYSLVALMDENLRVDRGAFEQSLAGLKIRSALVEYAVQVKSAVDSVRGKL